MLVIPAALLVSHVSQTAVCDTWLRSGVTQTRRWYCPPSLPGSPAVLCSPARQLRKPWPQAHAALTFTHGQRPCSMTGSGSFLPVCFQGGNLSDGLAHARGID